MHLPRVGSFPGLQSEKNEKEVQTQLERGELCREGEGAFYRKPNERQKTIIADRFKVEDGKKTGTEGFLSNAESPAKKR